MPSHARNTILVIEDDRSIRETFRIALEFRGFDVCSAENGKEGLEMLAHGQRPRAILLDLMMPVMDGWEFLDELEKSESWASIPVVVVTAFGKGAQACPNRPLIEKPVDLTVLYGTLDQLGVGRQGTR